MIRTKHPASGQMLKKEAGKSGMPVKDNPIPIYPKHYHHWGGHLPFPPRDCPCMKYTFIQDGIKWLDLAFCAVNQCGQAPCQRRQSYSHDEWKSEYLRLKGVQKGTKAKEINAK